MRDVMSTEGHRIIRLPKAAVWALAIFLALAFIRAGVSKLAGGSAVRWAERFAQWGYPSKAQYLIGVLELLSAVGLLIPGCRRAAAALLITLMVGALCTHAVHGEFPRLLPPLVLGGLALALYSARLRADATINSHRSDRVVPGGQSRMSFEGKTADLLWMG